MKIGTMNHPQRDVVEEIYHHAALGMEFIDLTLEPPTAASWRVDAKEICRALRETNFEVVGHTSYFLPMDSPFEEVRQGAVVELKRCLRLFGEFGAKWMNLHPGRYTPMHPRSFYLQRNLQTFEEILPVAQACGVGLMIENLPGDYNTADQLGELLDPMPELWLHLDIGHANLLVYPNSTEQILEKYGHRLAHVHLHDNKGGEADLHLPLGAGNVDVRKHVRSLKALGYDGTITLEVFSDDKTYLVHSAEVLRRIWQET